VLVRRFTGDGSGGRLSARMAKPRSLEFSFNLGFLSALDTINMWILVPVRKHCFEPHTVDAEPDDHAAGWKQDWNPLHVRLHHPPDSFSSSQGMRRHQCRKIFFSIVWPQCAT